MATTPCWNADLQARWAALSNWCRNEAMAARFRTQLQDATGWNPADCVRAIEEYRRFCLLACQCGGAVVPSAPVDAVWHLHLTYTRDYWGDFCPRRLGLELHHQPALGRPGEARRLREGYRETLHAYAALFEDPDPRWWPDDALTPLAPTPRLRRPWLRTLARGLLATGLLATGASQALPGTPLDWAGPDFLALYLALLVLGVLGSLLLRAWLRRQGEPASGLPGEAGVWELAWLAGGAGRLAETLVAELYRRRWVRWNPQTRTLLVEAAASDPDPLVQTAISAIRDRPSADLRGCLHSAAFAQVEARLQRRGWWFGRAEARRIALLSALPCALLVLFGLAKIAIGLQRDKPVGLLVALVVVALVASALFALRLPTRTRRGTEALRGYTTRHRQATRAPRDEDLPIGVALAGTGLFAGTALAGFHEARHPSGSNGSGSSSDSDSSGCSSGDGGGCGGCGGGGD